MLDGLTNIFQCNEREAIRIALYEASRRASKAYELAFRYADTKATDKAHQGRSLKKQWMLPKSEKDKASEAAKEIEITDAEFIRLAIIWLRNGIRNDSIKQLTKSKRIPKDDVAMQWSRTNQGKAPNKAVAKFKEARDDAILLQSLLNNDEEKEAYRKWFYKQPFNVRLQISDDETLEEAEAIFDFEQFVEEHSVEEWLIKQRMERYGYDRQLAIHSLKDDEEELEAMSKMTTKELIAHLRKQKAQKPIDPYRQEEIEDEERDLAGWKKIEEIREGNLLSTTGVQDIPDHWTWTSYVNTMRVAAYMSREPDPYPELPNPIPEGYPMPEGWPQENRHLPERWPISFISPKIITDGEYGLEYLPFKEREQERKDKQPPKRRKTIEQQLDEMLDDAHG